jgi:hypothetical protein
VLATFSDFIKQNPNCKKFEGDDDMQNIFDFLSRDYILVQLIEASDAGKPALAPVAENIEHFFADISKTHENTLNDNFTKQAVGLMVKTILEPFGYVVWKQKDLPKNSRAMEFQSASTYRFNATAPRSMKIVKRIEEINPIEA